MATQGRQEPAREQVFECSPPSRQLVTGKLPAGWQSEKYWIDLTPGAQLELPGDITFQCCMDRIDDVYQLRLVYWMGDQGHEITADLGVYLDLTVITGFPCMLIPRAIKSISADLPAAVLLEFARARPC